MRTPDVEVRTYVNTAARRQIEVSGYPIGHSLHGLIRQLVDGTPAPYDRRDRRIDFWEIALVRAPNERDAINHNMAGWHGAVDGTAALLRHNTDLLTGAGWIERERVVRAWKAQFQLDLDAPSLLSPIKSRFAFLLDLGYEITFDKDALSPHEYLAVDEVRYERGAANILIHVSDFRDGCEVTVELNGRQFGEPFGWSQERIAGRADQLKRELSAD